MSNKPRSTELFWTVERIEKLRVAVENGGTSAAMKIFPDKTVASIYTQCSKHGIRFRRMEPAKRSSEKPQRRTREQQIRDRIERQKATLAASVARLDGLEAERARRAVQREERERDKATKMLEQRHRKLCDRAEALRVEICKVKPEFRGRILAAAPMPTAMPSGPLKKTLDRKDRQALHARMVNFVIPQLVHELRCEGASIADAIAEMVDADFAPPLLKIPRGSKCWQCSDGAKLTLRAGSATEYECVDAAACARRFETICAINDVERRRTA